MEPTKSPLRTIYKFITHVETVEQVGDYWRIHLAGIPANFYAGQEKPDLQIGDLITFNFEKANPDALPC